MSEKSKLVICPYCGHTQSNKDRCEGCNGYFEPLSRMATQIAMGPWYVRDANQPFRPGCSMEVIRKQIKGGKIKANTVLRGPTTRQFWTVARFAPGIAHLLGYCDACGTHVDPADMRCHACGHSFLVHDDRNELGLQYSTDDAAEKAERVLEEKMRLGSLEKKADRTKAPEKKKKESSQAPAPAAPADGDKPAVGGDLLDQIIGTSSFATSAAATSSGITESFEHGSDLLEFERQPEMEPAADPARSPAAANAAALAAAAPAQPTGPVPQKSNTLMIVLLVVTNVVMLAAVVMFALFMMSQQNRPPAAPPPIPPVQDPGGGSASVVPRPDQRVVFSPPQTPAFNPRTNPGATQPAGPTTPNGPRPNPGNDPGTTSVTQLNVYMLEQAQQALNATPPDNTRALELLQRYKLSTPADHQWRGVDEEIARLEAELNRPQSDTRTIFDFDP